MRRTNHRDDGAHWPAAPETKKSRHRYQSPRQDRLPAVIGIDLHRGILIPPWRPCRWRRNGRQPWWRRTENSYSAARRSGIRLLRSSQRPAMSPKFAPIHSGGREPTTEGLKKDVERHNLDGLPGTEIIPGLYDPRDFVVDRSEALRLLCRDQCDFTFRPARHQYLLNHRHQRLELLVLRDRHPRQCFGLRAWWSSGLRRHHGWSCPARCGARVFPRRFWMGHAQRYRVRRHSPR